MKQALLILLILSSLVINAQDSLEVTQVYSFKRNVCIIHAKDKRGNCYVFPRRVRGLGKINQADYLGKYFVLLPESKRRKGYSCYKLLN